MKEGPDIARVASLIGDPARANMLTALMDGRALTATELASEAGVTKQTTSAHISRLIEGGLIEREVQGRHHYFRLLDDDVAAAIEALMGVAQRHAGKRVRTGPREPELRRARICYDHLAGDFGVAMLEAMKRKGWVKASAGELKVTLPGWEALSALDLSADGLPGTKRPECLACLDWSVRRHHLAGKTGAAVLERFLALKWARRVEGTRVIRFSPRGERAFMKWLDLEAESGGWAL